MGLKNWELRYYRDRQFKEGDTADFTECPEPKTGALMILGCKIESIFHGGKYGLEKGYCIFQRSTGQAAKKNTAPVKHIYFEVGFDLTE